MSDTTASTPAWARVLDPRDDDPAALRALRAWLAVQRLLAYEPVRAKGLLARKANPEAALAAGFGLRLDEALSEPAFALERAILAREGIRLVPPAAAAYPPRLAALADPAVVLAVRGDPAALSAPLVAIVGARAPSRLGLDVAHALASDLAVHGVGVVSGLARGIDAAAHRGALAARGLTVAVSGCGPDLVYPGEHAALADAIAAHGAIASELPLGAPPAKHHFPLRNRLISGLALAVVVVEARKRSGSLVTARHAADQGREVLAVPGSVLALTSEGPNLLLRSGAWPALDASDVLAAIGLGPATATERAALSRGAPTEGPLAHPRQNEPTEGRASEGTAGAGARSEPQASEAHQARVRRSNPLVRAGSTPARTLPANHPILLSLLHDPATRDELCARLGWTAQRVACELLPLELDGDVVEDRDGRLRVTRTS